jgi:hypothetical protein
MLKTTVYLPDELDRRLEAEAAIEGVSKAELVRRGVARLLEENVRPRLSNPLPVFRGGRTRTMEEIDHDLVDEIARRAARR